MKLIILAAGKGERLLPLTRNTPKPLLDLGNGATLLEEQIESVREAGGIDEILLVTGYLADQIDAKMRFYQRRGVPIRTLYNPFYEVSNNLMSLWLARNEMDGDFLVTNGDNRFSPDVFRGLAGEAGEGIHLAISRKTSFDHDDMKVALDGALVARVSKLLDDATAEAESPGLALVRGDRARALFRDHLEALGRQREYLDQFWLEVFNALYRGGVPVHAWWFDGERNWQEVDFHVDVRRLKENLASPGWRELAGAGRP